MKFDKPSGAGSIIRTIEPDILEEVESRLTGGEPTKVVAAWIQGECKLFLQMKPDTLRKNLERYKTGELRKKVLSRITEATHGLALPTIARRLNALDELERLAAIQRGRVDKMLGLEDGKPMLLKSTTEEIRALQGILVDMGKLQLDTGFLARATRSVKGEIVEANGEVKRFEWTEAQERLYQELERATAAIADV